MTDPPLGRLRRRDQIARIFRSIGDFFLPAVCPACVRRLSEEEYGLCAECAAQLERPVPPMCGYCGRQRPKAKPGGRCEACERLPAGGFDSARAPFLYAGPMIDTLHHLKYHRHEELSECLGRWLFLFWKEEWPEAGGVDRIVPVPLHLWRLWSRGFNQSESLGRVLSRFSGIEIATSCLTRIRHTRTQTRLNPKQRLRNVAEAFQVRDSEAVAGRRLLLIDDVMTSGATLAEAAVALKKAGAVAVYALALARAP